MIATKTKTTVLKIVTRLIKDKFLSLKQKIKIVTKKNNSGQLNYQVNFAKVQKWIPFNKLQLLPTFGLVKALDFMQESKQEHIGKTDFDSLTDERLVKLISDTKEPMVLRKCQEQIYDRYAQKVYFKCVNIVKDKEEAKDLPHDIMVKILLKIKSFRGDSPLFGWIYAIAYNHCLSWIQKKNRLKMQDFEPVERELADDQSDIDNKKLKELRLETIQNLMTELSQADRTILLMRYQDGYSVKDISDILELGESAVKMRLKRSRDRLSELVTSMQDNE